MIYLASPYSSPDPAIVEQRFAFTMKCLAELIGKRGLFVWSPIVHCHEMAVRYKLPKDAAYWQRFSIDFIRRCDGMYVLKLPGWKESIGVQEEIKFANSLFIPTTYLILEDYIGNHEQHKYESFLRD